MNLIDGGNREGWPPDVISCLGRFHQGSLVVSPPFGYYACTRHAVWQATRLLTPSTAFVEAVELDPDDYPPYGIITTQSCDIDEVGKPKKPWVQVAPVYELPPADGRLGDVLRWRVHYLAPVTSLGRTWVADLRIEFPIEKSWLVEQEPRDAFRTPEEFYEFARLCGFLRARPALANSIHDDVLEPLGQMLKALRETDLTIHEAIEQDVKHLYVAAGPDRLAPHTVQLIFVGEAPLGPPIVEQLDAWWEQHFGSRATAPTVLPNRYRSFAQVDFRESRHWVEVDLARLCSGS